MSRMFGFMANEPERLRCALFPARSALAAELASLPEGWGLGFYQGDEVLLQRRPKALQPRVDFYEAIRELQSDVVIGHARLTPLGQSPKTENTLPLRFRQWTFAHQGEVADFESFRPQFLAQIPDFLRRNIRGQTDSEPLFHLFLAQLHAENHLDDPNLSVRVAGKALQRTIHLVESLTKQKNRLNIVTTNGRIMLSTRCGVSLHMLRINGITDCTVCRDPTSVNQQKINHELLRGVLLVSNATPEGLGWEEIPDYSLVTISRDLVAQVASL